jgi:hypothetical protein
LRSFFCFKKWPQNGLNKSRNQQWNNNFSGERGGDKELPFFDPSSRFEAVLRSLEQPWWTNFKLITNNDLHYSAFYAIFVFLLPLKNIVPGKKRIFEGRKEIFLGNFFSSMKNEITVVFFGFQVRFGKT